MNGQVDQPTNGADGRDPVTGRFQKGWKGGPGGITKMPVLTPLIRTKVQEEHPAFPGRTRGEVMVEKLMDLACAGDIAAFKEVIQRLDGKVVQPIDVRDGDERPARIELPERPGGRHADAFAAGHGHRNGDAP